MIERVAHIDFAYRTFRVQLSFICERIRNQTAVLLLVSLELFSLSLVQEETSEEPASVGLGCVRFHRPTCDSVSPETIGFVLLPPSLFSNMKPLDAGLSSALHEPSSEIKQQSSSFFLWNSSLFLSWDKRSDERGTYIGTPISKRY